MKKRLTMNGKRHNHKGRIPTFSSPRHSANALLIFLPAFIFACCSKYYPETCGTVSAGNTGLYLKSSPDGDTGLAGMEADVFFYNNDALGRIDSYQRLTIGDRTTSWMPRPEKDIRLPRSSAIHRSPVTTGVQSRPWKASTDCMRI